MARDISGSNRRRVTPRKMPPVKRVGAFALAVKYLKLALPKRKVVRRPR